MSYKSLTILLDEVRTSAEEKDFSSTTGITDAEVIRFLNQGKNIIYRKLINASQNLFTKKISYNIARDQKEVTLPYDIYGKNRILDVKVFENDCAYQVKYATEKHDIRSSVGRPTKYYRLSDSIRLIPKNDESRTLELTYIVNIPRLDKKAASVDSVTILDNVITALTFNTSTDSVNLTELDKYVQFTVVNRKGQIKAANIEFDSIDSGTGVVTLTAGQTLSAGETIAPGDIVVPGPYSSTHSGLELDVEEYAIEYAVMRLFQRSGSNEIGSQAQLVIQLENSIMETYSNISDDVPTVLTTGFKSDGWL